MLKPLLNISLLLLLIPLLSQGQKRHELKKCIETYKWQYVQKCVFPADTSDMKKAVAGWMYLNDFSYNVQTDSSVTFSRPISYGGVVMDIPWEEQWFYNKFNYLKRRTTGIVTVRVGFQEVKHGMDISVIAYTRDPRSTIYDECYMPVVEPLLREYLFAALDFEVPIWPEELGQAVEDYNTSQIYPDRKLALR
ncbi:MAG: hypothetical protein ACI9FU_002158 [Granulosicoccus sp.]|jgi:hypothetical protein